MALNKVNNMYDFVETWNPLAGECAHLCSYCHVKSQFHRPAIKAKYTGPPRLHEKAFKGLGKDKTLFVCSQTDLFAHDVSSTQIMTILDHCKKYPQNKYFIQTKNPHRMSQFIYLWDYEFPKDIIICTTIETNRDYELSKAPLPRQRASAMMDIPFNKMVTVEPIMDFDIEYMVPFIARCEPFQVNIGADSKRNNLPEPSPEKIKELIKELEKFTTVKLKPNLKRLVPELFIEQR